MNYLPKIINEFANEARNSPTLFSDLAKLESYIAESYSNRALVELLQNADDVGAKSFSLLIGTDYIVCTNDGRPFSESDVVAICRSGASNKKRGESIGYRGIGFKSTVLLGSRISVLSKPVQFQFSRDLTEKFLNSGGNSSSYPLIRLPHPIDQNTREALENLIEPLSPSYSNAFCFEGRPTEESKEMLGDFSVESLLFLRNISTVKVINDGKEKSYTILRKQSDGFEQKIEITDEAGNTSNWQTISSGNTRTAVLAFKVNKSGDIEPCDDGEAKTYCFLPTLEPTGFRFKANGNFTTDPSRKTITLDSDTDETINELAIIGGSVFASAIETPEKYPNILSAFVSASSSSRFSQKLSAKIKENIAGRVFGDKNSSNKFRDLVLKPMWLNSADFKNYCTERNIEFSEDLISKQPFAFQALESIGIRKATVKDIWGEISNLKLSSVGTGEFLAKLSETDLPSSNLDPLELKSIRLVPTGDGGSLALSEVKDLDSLDEKFLEVIKEKSSLFALRHLLISAGNNYLIRKVVTIDQEKNKTISNSPELNVKSKDTVAGFVENWRKAEEVVAIYLRTMQGVKKVTDVSLAKLGYDLEILMDDGARFYIETKALAVQGAPFKITNNEMSTAHDLGDAYVMALVRKDEHLLIDFIRNPAKNLSFTKQVEQWSWACTAYSSADQKNSGDKLPWEN